MEKEKQMEHQKTNDFPPPYARNQAISADGKWRGVVNIKLDEDSSKRSDAQHQYDFNDDSKLGHLRKVELNNIKGTPAELHFIEFGRRMQEFLASPDRSAPSLLEKLYTMDKALEVVRLLALNTMEFKHEFFNYAKEGKMVEVGALLLAAGEKLMPLSIFEVEEPLNSFKEISGFLQAKNSNIDESAELKETVKLLDIYDEIGSQLSTCVALKENRRSGVEVAALLKDAGFYGKIDDGNVQDCVNRSNIALFEFKVPKMYSSWDRYLSFCKQKLSLSNLMNKTLQRFPSLSKSQDPSLGTKQLPDTTSINNNMGSSYQFGTVATKLVKAIQKVRHSRQYGSWSMRSFPK